MFSVYSIEEIFSGSTRDRSIPRGVHYAALNEMGLRYTPSCGTRDRVSVKTSGYTSWGVDIPSDRVQEYVRKLWENEHTTQVTIGGVDFPKPRTVADVEKEFAAFKQKVFGVASRTRREEDWCRDGFKAAMKELGIEVPSTKIRVVLELDLDDHDTDLNATSALADIKNFLKWDVDQADLGDAVVSVEPVKDEG